MDNIEELCDKLAIIHNVEKILDGKINDIRQQFFNQEYIIEFTDNEIYTGETQINGFEIVQTKLNSFHRKEITVKLNENQTPQELYDSIITRFGIDYPSKKDFTREFNKTKAEVKRSNQKPQTKQAEVAA